MVFPHNKSFLSCMVWDWETSQVHMTKIDQGSFD
jgi:hypothetical protein